MLYSEFSRNKDEYLACVLVQNISGSACTHSLTLNIEIATLIQSMKLGFLLHKQTKTVENPMKTSVRLELMFYASVNRTAQKISVTGMKCFTPMAILYI